MGLPFLSVFYFIFIDNNFFPNHIIIKSFYSQIIKFLWCQASLSSQNLFFFKVFYEALEPHRFAWDSTDNCLHCESWVSFKVCFPISNSFFSNDMASYLILPQITLKTVGKDTIFSLN